MARDLLEFSSLKGYIRSFIASDVGMRALEDLGPFDSWQEAAVRSGLVKEIMDLLQTDHPLHIVPVEDIACFLDTPQGGIINGPDLHTISCALRAMARVKGDLEASGFLGTQSSMMMDLDGIYSELDACLEPDGGFKEGASPGLKRLKGELRSLRAGVVERMGDLLETLKGRSVVMEEIITTRNDRYVIPLRPDYSSRLSGITHDYSRTRQSAYVEPLEMVEANNRLSLLRCDIRDEQARILRDLTGLVLERVSAIKKNLEVYGLIDLVQACARWAIKTCSTIPGLSRGEVHLKGARHPVLLEKKGGCVPLDIHIPVGTNCMILSGPNAGGKTVALKTLGLIITMARSGLPVPCDEGSVIPPVQKIWVAMDINQDIEQGLSSFTAQALAIKEIYKSVQANDLVILDEPGSGTDHEPGGAMAVSVIDALRKKGALVVVSSHSDLVKLYSGTSQGVVNAALSFDDKSLRPLYAIEYGVTGTSHAFDILESIGFPGGLLEEARGIVSGNSDSGMSSAMRDLSMASRMRHEAEQELKEARRIKDLAASQHEALRRQGMENAIRYKRFFEKIRDPGAKHCMMDPQQAEVKEEFARILESTSPGEVLDVHEGSIVCIRGSSTQGVVKAVNGLTAEVMFGDKRMKLGIERLEMVLPGAVARKDRAPRTTGAYPWVAPVVLVGMRVDEALSLMEKAFDRALLSGQEYLEVVHGSGTGALRKAVHGYLSAMPGVRFNTDPGAGNLTIIRFR